MAMDPNPYAAPQASIEPAAREARDPGGLTRLSYVMAHALLLLGTAIPFIGPVVVIAWLVLIPVLAWRRMKNTGYHPALGLLILVPLANLWAGTICLAAQTDYRHQRSFDGIGWTVVAIAGCLFALLVLAVLAIAVHRHA
jgi:hypothetical protein